MIDRGLRHEHPKSCVARLRLGGSDDHTAVQHTATGWRWTRPASERPHERSEHDHHGKRDDGSDYRHHEDILIRVPVRRAAGGEKRHDRSVVRQAVERAGPDNRPRLSPTRSIIGETSDTSWRLGGSCCATMRYRGGRGDAPLSQGWECKIGLLAATFASGVALAHNAACAARASPATRPPGRRSIAVRSPRRSCLRRLCRASTRRSPMSRCRTCKAASAARRTRSPGL